MQAAETNDALAINLKGLELLLGDITETVRDVLTMLRPKIVTQSGVLAALRWLVETIQQRSTLKISISLPENEPPLTKDQAIALFRIVQESLTNVLKHAKAEAVKIVLLEQNQQLLLSIQDNGQGCASHNAQHSTGFGLSGMRERVQSMQGMFEWESKPGDGTHILMTIPLSLPAHPNKR